MNNIEWKFKAEYAKSNRSQCRFCHSKINCNELRLAIMVQSTFFDGRIPTWYHYDCFWYCGKVLSEDDFPGLDNLRWDDQEKIRKRIQGESVILFTLSELVVFNIFKHYTSYCLWTVFLISSGAILTVRMRLSSLRNQTFYCLWTNLYVFYLNLYNYECNNEAATKSDEMLEISVDQPIRSSLCALCRKKVQSVRMHVRKGNQKTRKSYDIDCFFNTYDSVQVLQNLTVDKIIDFDLLPVDCQQDIQNRLQKRKIEIDSEHEKKKRKEEEGTSNSKGKCFTTEEKEKKMLNIQCDKFWEIKDNLRNNLTKREMEKLLLHNGQQITRKFEITSHLADCIMFGPLEPCPACEQGQLFFSSRFNSYLCGGDISAWTKCKYSTQKPGRKKFTIPELLSDNNYLKCLPKDGEHSERLFSSRRPLVSNLLKGINFFIQPDLHDVKRNIEKLGGTVVAQLTSKVMLAIFSESSLQSESCSNFVLKMSEKRIACVSESFVDQLQNIPLHDALAKCKINSWDADSIEVKRDQIGYSSLEKKTSGSSKRKKFEEDSDHGKVIIKGGGAVHACSGLHEIAHVYQQNGKPYDVVLNAVDVDSGRNSYYKLQILKHDHLNQFWVSRAWGRIGTTIGSHLLESFDTALEAVEFFCEVYLEKTGNGWNSKKFVKYSNKFYPVKIDYFTKIPSPPKIKPGSKSTLPKAVKELMKLIFNVQAFKHTMLEFSVDLNKMPLGNLATDQIQRAFNILSQVKKILKMDNSQLSEMERRIKITDYSNQFYTLIPHNFGIESPTLLNTEDLLKIKWDLLENLKDIHIAYKILHCDTGDEDPMDVHYAKLCTKIEPLSKRSAEYKRIVKYAQNTHASTHDGYTLQIENVFSVERSGELERYAEFKKLHNRMLLWHGSRLSNFVGIISQGLRIAPPESLITGHMFGKGIYFADMVSKSANYCNATTEDPHGLLLLCEVALGDMYELTEPEFLTKLPRGKHSVKGLGMNVPNPAEVEIIDDGVMVPLGKAVQSNIRESSLQYNEYVIYNVKQMNIKYLVKMKFQFK
ncbi:Poly [ADP-ribose] polymerase 1 [Trichinella pseudospiralis]|uniref:Poly [ADP-ribose] polymerase n=1 Tax=Trichinella pseudospiralis TaxID=6337 RepID=A0A0V1FV95_TRIPS|nr:Poly [ADP-ribose] polymerase 1 [Trichinella pseudospiralis]